LRRAVTRAREHHELLAHTHLLNTTSTNRCCLLAADLPAPPTLTAAARYADAEATPRARGDAPCEHGLCTPRPQPTRPWAPGERALCDRRGQALARRAARCKPGRCMRPGPRLLPGNVLKPHGARDGEARDRCGASQPPGTPAVHAPGVEHAGGAAQGQTPADRPRGSDTAPRPARPGHQTWPARAHPRPCQHRTRSCRRRVPPARGGRGAGARG